MLHRAIQPSQLITRFRYTPGRRGWIVSQLRTTAEALAFGPIVARCDEHLPIERGLVLETLQWSLTSDGATGSVLPQALVAADQGRDRIVRALETVLEHQSLLPGGSSDASRQLLSQNLPSGSDAILSLTCDEVSEVVDQMVEALRTAHFEAVEAAGVKGWVDALDTRNAAFKNLYQGLDAARRTTWRLLRSADSAANERFLELIAYVLDVARGAGATELRSQLLAPLIEQDAHVRGLFRNAVAIGDVDPDNGKPIGALAATAAA